MSCRSTAQVEIGHGAAAGRVMALLGATALLALTSTGTARYFSVVDYGALGDNFTGEQRPPSAATALSFSSQRHWPSCMYRHASVMPQSCLT